MRSTIITGALLGLLAVGCADMVHQPATTADPPPEDGAVTGPAVDPAAPSTAGSGGDAPPSGDAAPPAGEPGPEVPTPALLDTAPLARTVHPLTEHGGALEVELRAERLTDLLRVAVTFTPRGIDPGRTALTTLLGAAGTHETVTARLVDPVNLLEYTTIRPAVADAHMAPASRDHPTTLVFYFGAPVEPMETADFLLDLSMTAPDWPGFLDVPFGSV